MEKAMYARIASDPSQIKLFKDDFIDGKIGLPARPVDTSKTYSLTFAYGIVQWVAQGEQPVRPVPPEPTIYGSELALSKNDSVVEHDLIIPEVSVSNHEVIL